MDALPVLVVEDDADLREALVDTLRLAGVRTLTASDGEGALALLRKQAIGLIISDAQMQPMDGYRLFHEAKHKYPAVPFILMTAYGVVERAVELLRAGACHYLVKPFEPSALVSEVERYRLKPLPDWQGAENLVATSPAMCHTLDLARRVAASDATVLITGESGVGKEVLARFIHAHSPRQSGPFVAVNCAAIPDTLLESTLFGHEKGAFTGALHSAAGKFEQAQGGTLLTARKPRPMDVVIA